MLRVACLVVAGVVLAGCMTAEEQMAMQRMQDQDRCASFGYYPGSEAYADCMMGLSVERDRTQFAQRVENQRRWDDRQRGIRRDARRGQHYDRRGGGRHDARDRGRDRRDQAGRRPQQQQQGQRQQRQQQQQQQSWQQQQAEQARRQQAAERAHAEEVRRVREAIEEQTGRQQAPSGY